MKRVLLCLMMILLLAGCKKTSLETPREVLLQDQIQYLTELQTELQTQDQLMGVAYIGCADGAYPQVMGYIRQQAYLEALPFIGAVEADHFCQNDGGELYCVVPRDKSVSLSVHKAELNASYELSPGELLLCATDGKAILLQGNISEIVPNLFIIAADGERIQEYTPCRSGADGYLVNRSHAVYDFSPYAWMDEFMGRKRELEQPLDGRWTASVTDRDQGVVTMELSFAPEGGLTYGYCIGGVWHRFSGSWEVLMDDTLRLMMWGGAVDEQGALLPDAAHEADGCYVWECTPACLKLMHQNGDPLYPAALVTGVSFFPAEE